MAAEQPPASSVPVLPPYPELILAAIEAIGSKNGAPKTKISRQILSTYDILPAAHSTLLSHHLNKMKASGELVFALNNYAIPDPNASPKRGRGRPAKPKEPVPEGAVVSPPRPRGRPAKPRDESVPVAGASPVVSPPRPRGRPAKPRDESAPVAVSATPKVSGQKRGRGRPPKLGKKKAPAPFLLPSGERRGRGRPPKNAPVAAAPVGA